MKHHIFHSDTPSKGLILLFAGWGMDEKPFRDISVPGYDLCVVWDYRDSSCGFEGALEGYSEIAVVAWSFGVPAAAHFILTHKRHPVTAKIAVNGTQHPVDDSMGIPTGIFKGTLEGLSEKSLGKFYLRMAGSGTAFKCFSEHLPSRDIPGLKAELEAIEKTDSMIALWDKALVADNDRIIPPTNQLNAWKTEAMETCQYHGDHLPDFNRLLNDLLTDKSLVKRRFSRASSTYDSNAVIQQQIARRLIDLCGHPDCGDGRILEIGCGTGTATRLIRERYPSASLSLWDLTISERLADEFGSSCTLSACDAETSIRTLPDESFDAVVSASTVQWFNSLPAFLLEVRRILRPGGTAAISTFGPQTMREINDTLGKSSPYPTLSALSRMIPEGMSVEHLTEETITLTFPTPIDALRHVRLTGVNAVHSDTSPADTRSLLRNYPLHPSSEAPLTYHPIYIILRKQTQQ